MTSTKRKSVGGLLKEIAAALTAMIKAKSLAVKSKTNALRTRLIIFSLLSNKKVFFGSISDKLQNLALTGKQHLNKKDKRHSDEDNPEEVEPLSEGKKQAIVMYNYNRTIPTTTSASYEEEEIEDEEDDKYPDLTHGLFDDLEFENPGGSVIDLVKKTKKEGEEFKLEDEIDEVADLFIKRFHNQMRLQKQLSFELKKREKNTI